MSLVLPLHLLVITPMWLVALLAYLLTIGVIWTLRDWQEGLAYNVARSSQLGDACLIAIVLIGVGMLQDGKPVPGWLDTAGAELLILSAALAVGAVWYFGVDPTRRWGDAYHHLVVAPLLVFFGLNAGVIVLYNGGWGAVAACFLIVGWAGLVLLEGSQGRLDQSRYLREKLGIRLPPQ